MGTHRVSCEWNSQTFDTGSKRHVKATSLSNSLDLVFPSDCGELNELMWVKFTGLCLALGK